MKERITFNLQGTYKIEYLNNRKHYVVPATILKEGVLNGSQGPIFYPKDCYQNAEDWNTIPLVCYHPQTVSGKELSARSASVLNNQGIGIVLNSQANEDLGVEAWFDVDATSRIDEKLDEGYKILPRIENNTPIELSTGVTVAANKAPEGSVFNGKAYNYVVESIKPDHLAVLPDQKGACSLLDGCGVGVVANEDPNPSKEVIYNLSEQFLTVNKMSHEDIRESLNKALKAGRTQDQPFAWIHSVFDNEVIYEEEGKLFKLSYSVSEGGVSLSGTPVEVVRETSFVSVSNKESTDMTIAELVDLVIANCDCWTDQDKPLLNKMSEQQLRVLSNNKEPDKRDPQPKLTNNTSSQEPAMPKQFEKDGYVFTLNSEGNYVAVKKESAKKLEVANFKNLSTEEFLDMCPPEVANILNSSMDALERESNQLIDKITHNMDDDKKAKTIESLKGRSREDLLFLAEQVENFQAGQVRSRVANRIGQLVGGGQQEPNESLKKRIANSILPLPTMDMFDQKKDSASA